MARCLESMPLKSMSLAQLSHLPKYPGPYPQGEFINFLIFKISNIQHIIEKNFQYILCIADLYD